MADEAPEMWLLREKTIVGAFLVAIAVIGVLGVASYRTIQGLLDAEASVVHTHDVIDSLDDLSTDITAVESAARGFVLTGDQTYLSDDSAARSGIEHELENLQRLTAENAIQKRLLPELKAQLIENLALHEQMIGLRVRNDAQGARARNLMSSGQGHQMMEDIQSRIDQMQDEEKKLLQARTSAAHDDAQLLTAILLVGSLLSLTVLSAVFIHLVWEVRRRRASEMRLHRVNQLFFILSQCNQAIVRIGEVAPLLHKVCAITIERRFFKSAWVGLVDDETGELKPAASSDDASLRFAGPWLPLPNAVDEPSFICNDIASDPRVSHEREKVLGQGIRSAGIFRLEKFGKVAGVFCVYAADPNVFENDIVALLKEITDDLSFALQNMEHERIRRHAEEEVRHLNQVLESRIQERTAELAKLNTELEESNKELARASQLKSEFVSRMSHELRTPLNAVTGYLDLLAEESAGELNAKQKRYVGHVRTGAGHLLELVNEVLDLSKIEAGRIQLYLDWFNAADALLEVLASTQPLAATRNISVEHVVDASMVIYADRLRLKQILFNLISNALKFTPEQGQVRIEFAYRDDSVYITVADNGIGIPPDEQLAIFDEFHQGVTTKGVKEGTGLGLAITKRLIEQHCGKIWVKSETGSGSQFTFTIPSSPVRSAGAGA
jgi:signal transduction histidine kinase/CHASE3 domain sensor protein